MPSSGEWNGSSAALGESISVRYHAASMHTVPDHDRWLSEPEADRLNRFVHVKRRSESRLGRWAAKQTVALMIQVPVEHGVLREIIIRNASDGAPEVWRDDTLAGLPISMTDRADWAVSVITDSRASLGCDLELVEPRSELFVRDYFTASEQHWVAEHRDDQAVWANLIWSAKESALKVLREGLRRDTRSVEVRFGSDQIGEWQSFQVSDVQGGSFHGWWQRFDRFLLTVCADVPIHPPEPLTQPSPLTGAQPTHAWMQHL